MLYYLLLYVKKLADIKGENNLVNHKETFMKEALKEAKKAYKKLEIPVGAVIVKDGEIIAKAHNLRENKNSSIAHAEILASASSWIFNNSSITFLLKKLKSRSNRNDLNRGTILIHRYYLCPL